MSRSLAAAVLILTSALAADGRLLTTLWSVPDVVNTEAGAAFTVATSDGVVVLNDNNDTVHGINASTGERLWSLEVAAVTGSSSYQLFDLRLDLADQTTVQLVYTNNVPFTQLTAVSSKGEIVGGIPWGSMRPTAQGVYGWNEDNTVVAFGAWVEAPAPARFTVARFNVVKETFTETVLSGVSQFTWGDTVGKDVMVIASLNVTSGATDFYSLNSTTLDTVCTFSVPNFFGFFKPFQTGNLVHANGFYDATTCQKVLPEFSTELGDANQFTVTSSGAHYYVLDNTAFEVDGTSAAHVSQVNSLTAVIDWTTTVAVTNFSHTISVFPEAHDPRFFILMVDGALNVVWKDSGKLALGENHIFFPYSPGNSRRQLLFELKVEPTTRYFLLPNLQGYVIFDNSKPDLPLLEVNQHTPITPPLTYNLTSTNQPYVIWGDLTTGALEALMLP